jgi:catechol 2,3-dioxygenase-like lactoylglutathione lyase family enzyme
MNSLAHWLRPAIVMRGITSFLATVSLCQPLAAQTKPTRPRITGIAQVRLYVTDLGKSREFYTRVLGLPIWGSCVGVASPCLGVNPVQHVQLELSPSAPSNWLAETAFATDDAAQMRRYLQTHGIKVGRICKEPSGAQYFRLHDPEGNPIAFVQASSSAIADDPPPADIVGTRLFHTGFVVHNAAIEDRFYRDILGFRMYWHGGFKDNDVDWEELQVSDGSDWIEYMLNIPSTADHKELGIQNHFSLGVTKITSAYNLLVAHGWKPNDDDKPEIGRDGKWSFDIYDPDQTRVEFMEYRPAQKPCCHPYEAPHPVP